MLLAVVGDGRTGSLTGHHAKVEFILVLLGDLLAQRLEHLLLLLVVLGTLLVVLLLFEETETLTFEGLGALLMGAALDAAIGNRAG